MNWVLKLFICILLIQLNTAVNIIPQVIYTERNASYTAMLVIDDDYMKPEKCYLSDFKFTYNVELEIPGVTLDPINTVPENATINTTNILTSLGNGICGFKLENVDSDNFIRKWNISFWADNGAFYHQKVDVIIYDSNIKNETIEAKIGSQLSIPCGKSENIDVRNLISCSLYNPSGTRVLSKYNNYDGEGCSYYVKLSNRFHFGQWKCILNLRYNMSPKEFNFNVIKEDNQIVYLWQNETDTHVNIGCYIKETVSTEDIEQCEMIRPDGTMFVFKEGFATNRYTGLSTRLSKGICGIEIEKPLENFEKGLWRCAIRNIRVGDNNYPTGGFINLTDESSTLPPPKPIIPEQITVLEKENIYITCEVPYSSRYCFIRSPDGDIHESQNNLEPLLGICKYTEINARSYHTGTWSCGFAKENGQPDDEYTFKVLVPEDSPVNVETPLVEATIGKNASFLCSTEADIPIQYCRFRSNLGEMYYIDPEETFTDRISYYGRGLEYGDCGIEINPTTLEDVGDWTCYTRVGNNFNNGEVYRKMQLIVRYIY